MERYVRVKCGMWGGHVLKDIDFPLASDPPVVVGKEFVLGTRGHFIRVNGEGLAGFPQRNFKIFIHDPAVDAQLFTAAEPPVDVQSTVEETPETVQPESLAQPVVLRGHRTLPEAITHGKVLGGDDESTESSDEIKARISKRFGILRQMTVECSRGNINSLVVSGASGSGKSFEIIKALDDMNIFNRLMERIDNQTPEQLAKQAEQLSCALGADIQAPEPKDDEPDMGFCVDPEPPPPVHSFEVVKGYISPPALHRVLYENRDKHRVLIFDDCDAVLGEENSLNSLKAALDSGEHRIVRWEAERRDGTPTRFEYNGSIIFVTNLDFHRIIDRGTSKLVPHLEAILDRSLYLDLGIRTIKERLSRIDHVCNDLGLLSKQGLDPKESKEVLDWMHENATRFDKLSIRKVLHLASLRKMPGDWESTAEIMLLRR